MRYLKGKLSKPQSFRTLLDVVKGKGIRGKITITLPYGVEELSLCYDGSSIRVETFEELSPDFVVKRFVEKWILSGTYPTFVLSNAEGCKGNYIGTLSEDELFEIMESPLLEAVKELPESFIIKSINVSGFPSLVSYRATKKPLMKRELHKLGISILDFVKLIKEGMLEIEPYDYQEAMPLKARVIVVSLLALSFSYFLLPLNLSKFSDLKLLDALNWALKEKVINEDVELKILPVNDCLGKKIWLIENAVVSPGFDWKLWTSDDKRKLLPKSGYKPFFAIPVK